MVGLLTICPKVPTRPSQRENAVGTPGNEECPRSGGTCAKSWGDHAVAPAPIFVSSITWGSRTLWLSITMCCKYQTKSGRFHKETIFYWRLKKTFPCMLL